MTKALEEMRGGPLPRPIEEQVAECADMVMLDVAYSPVIEKAGSKDTTEVTRREDGTYCLTYRNALCPDLAVYEPVSEADLKVMRARYLVTRGESYTRLHSMDDAERDHALATFFNGGVWTPRQGSALSEAMGMERCDGTLDKHDGR
jgi:hypothetical protein